MIAFAFSGSVKAVTIHHLAEYTAEHATGGWLGLNGAFNTDQVKSTIKSQPTNERTNQPTNQPTTGNNVSTVCTNTHMRQVKL